jgi:hypothetical protein
VPPLVGVAVKVTLVPVHIVCAPVVMAIDTEGGDIVFTVIVIAALVTDVGLAQAALLVMVTVIASLLAKVVLVNVAFVAPLMLTPPFFH